MADAKHRILTTFRHSWRLAITHKLDVLFVALSLIAFLVGARYVDYPDEYVNLLGGQSILRGSLPYVDFWDHHLPGAWFGSAILLALSGGSFVLFRVLWALFSWGLLVGVSFLIPKKHELRPYYMGFVALYPMVALYFWLHLFLADGIAALFFSASFWLIIAQWTDTHVNRSGVRLVVAAFLTFAMIFASATYVYMAAGLYLMIAYLWLSKRVGGILTLVGYVLLPYVLFELYLLLTGSFADFYFANIVYNSTYYISIPNYVRGEHFNPIKFALTLVSNFYDGYLPLLSKIKHLDLYLPVATLSGLATLVLGILLLFSAPIMGVAYIVLLSFSAPRSNISAYKETDYQMGMFIVLGMASSAVLLFLLRRIRAGEVVGDVLRVVRGIVFVFAVATVMFLGFNTYSKAFQMYTQKLPSIHNRGFTAEFFDEILYPGDTYFAGPYEPQDLFYTKVTPFAGRHPSLLPQFREGDVLRESFIRDMERLNPTLIVYKHEASIFGTPAMEFGAFFVEWMKPAYRSIETIEGVEVLKTPSSFNMKSDLYLRRDQQKELLQKLEEKGYIQIESLSRS